MILFSSIILFFGFNVWVFSTIYNLVHGWNQPQNATLCVVTHGLSLLVTLQNTSGALLLPNGLFVWERNPSDTFCNSFHSCLGIYPDQHGGGEAGRCCFWCQIICHIHVAGCRGKLPAFNTIALKCYMAGFWTYLLKKKIGFWNSGLSGPFNIHLFHFGEFRGLLQGGTLAEQQLWTGVLALASISNENALELMMICIHILALVRRCKHPLLAWWWLLLNIIELSPRLQIDL